jgi:gamma-glutamyltranspeptidase / glutathione hydrolase
MFLVHLKDGKAFALDGSSRAPFAVVPGHFSHHHPLKLGIEATTVPSTPAALGYALEAYGSLPLKDVLEPAINAAKKGFKVTALQHRLLSQASDALLRDELAKGIFFKGDQPLGAGQLLKQPQLAALLERLASFGWRDFYTGEIGEKILTEMKKRGGLITRADLSQIPIPIERQPLISSYRDLEVATFPPPGAGRALVQILNTLEHFEPEELSPEDPDSSVIFALAFRAALTNREKSPMDPDIYPQTQDKKMLDKAYAQKIAQRIKKLMGYCPSPLYSPPKTAGETTHLSVADAYGNSVGITQSIELVFGSKTMAAELGFFYNNYMSAFDYKDMMHPSYLLPGGRPWSSVAPTLLSKEGKGKFLLGSPGSERISTSLAQVISRLVDFGQDLAQAVEAPRLHAGSSGTVLIEKKRFAPEVLDALSQTGFEVKKRGAYSFYLGCVQAVAFPSATGDMFYGVSDPRRDGSAKGPKKI